MEELEIAQSQESKEDVNIQAAYKRARFWLAVNAGFFLLALILLAIVFWVITNTKEKLDASNLPVRPEEEGEAPVDRSNLVEHALSGELVPPSLAHSQAVAVMIDNHQDARPPSGLSQAKLVYEAEAEGGITRYLAIFTLAQDLDEIGPIRSARPYFIDLSQGLDALYVHVGGSPAALARIAAENIPHMNQFYQGQYFWRDEDKPRPHNVYTSTDLVQEYCEDNGFALGGRDAGWFYKDEASAEARPQDPDPIRISYTFDGHEVKWLYNHSENEYLRYVDKKPHKDSSDSLIRAKNVIIQWVNGEVLDEKLRLDMDVIGEGEAMACLDGACQKVDWQKKDAENRVRYYQVSGEEFEFNRGTTWVQFVRPHIEVEY